MSLMVSNLNGFLAEQLQMWHAAHITGNFKVAAHIDHSEYASLIERIVLVALKKNENRENMK